ncbi:F-box domain-containing protein [Colletotrichum sojae]|uniref:F-box domain-containing protein n=1 Tax=Colletotrichum sojae TaxID=2175907 RepID=A0A8H6MW37_9PEZI|nr:F-box domain-containing protein [Colletotrichum sojae]
MSQPTSSPSALSTTAAPTIAAPTIAAPTDPQAASNFNKIPLEVLLRISSSLTTPELGNLRLTCRSIEQSLFNTFMREFFTKRQFMLTENSLQALVGISKSRLSDCLDHVIIGLNHFPRQYFSPGQEVRANRYRKAHADHLTLVYSGQDVAMLTEAFRNLKNLHTVGIRDYNSRERQKRDGTHASWSSYGATTLWKETGVDLLRNTNAEDAQQYANKVIITLFTALGDAGARPKAFEYLRKKDGVPSDDGFNLFPNYLKPKVAPVLEGLETLMLVVNVGNGPGRTTTGGSRPQHDYLLRHFLGYLPNLKHLRLNFHSIRVGVMEPVEDFINWLGTPVPHDPVPSTPSDSPLLHPAPPVAFPHLEELNLGFIDLAPKALLNAIRKFAPSLKRLELWRVTLWNQAADDPNARDLLRTNLWAQTLKALREIPHLELDHIKIGQPNQRTLFMQTAAWFHRKDGPPDERLMVQEYTGIDWKHYVGELAARVKVEAPPEPESDSDENDDDDDVDDSLESADDLMDGEYAQIPSFTNPSTSHPPVLTSPCQLMNQTMKKNDGA